MKKRGCSEFSKTGITKKSKFRTLAVGKGCSLFWRSISKHLELLPELQQDRAREEQEQVYTQKLDVGDEEVSV